MAARRRADADSTSASVAKRGKSEEEEEEEESHRTSRTPPSSLCYSWLKLDPDEWGRRVEKREGSQPATAESNRLTIISAIRKKPNKNFIMLQTLYCLTPRQKTGALTKLIRILTNNIIYFLGGKRGGELKSLRVFNRRKILIFIWGSCVRQKQSIILVCS